MCSCFYYSIISIIDELKAYGMLLNLKTFCMVLFPVSDNFVSTETESTAFFFWSLTPNGSPLLLSFSPVKFKIIQYLIEPAIFLPEN